MKLLQSRDMGVLKQSGTFLTANGGTFYVFHDVKGNEYHVHESNKYLREAGKEVDGQSAVRQ